MIEEVRDSLQQPYRFQILNLDKGAYNDNLLGFDLERSIKKFIFGSLKKYKIYWDSSKLTILSYKNKKSAFYNNLSVLTYNLTHFVYQTWRSKTRTENRCKHLLFLLADKISLELKNHPLLNPCNLHL